MNKTDLVELIAKNSEISKLAAGKILDVLVDAIATSLGKGEEVSLIGFGTFVVSKRIARKGRNPRTGEVITIPESSIPKFRPGKALKEKWDMIPPDVDILVTHAPPAGILDQDGPVSHGCSDLTAAVAALKPKYHIFGHIHSNHGMIKYGPTSYINCNVQGENGALRSALLLDYKAGKLTCDGQLLSKNGNQF